MSNSSAPRLPPRKTRGLTGPPRRAIKESQWKQPRRAIPRRRKQGQGPGWQRAQGGEGRNQVGRQDRQHWPRRQRSERRYRKAASQPRLRQAHRDLQLESLKGAHDPGETEGAGLVAGRLAKVPQGRPGLPGHTPPQADGQEPPQQKGAKSLIGSSGVRRIDSNPSAARSAPVPPLCRHRSSAKPNGNLPPTRRGRKSRLVNQGFREVALW